MGQGDSIIIIVSAGRAGTRGSWLIGRGVFGAKMAEGSLGKVDGTMSGGGHCQVFRSSDECVCWCWRDRLDLMRWVGGFSLEFAAAASAEAPPLATTHCARCLVIIVADDGGETAGYLDRGVGVGVKDGWMEGKGDWVPTAYSVLLPYRGLREKSIRMKRKRDG
ncbi:uncharacterized protein K452DRAFT_53591 [Aplosporella prunicola CBS 121167]|uniref:Uncharacterized protein n=1 Tax=Aplosporella prunicola CBS 121167 TaxID=1176127 RepID=A0A6A6B8K5_9PEZI|nr:uncharacterized protein K452DRAFT_53591 [Aplosporella prunicola CBS 121167]KAF2140266.1 hypothetical protein K452DRAFT_53591 [Aplosporella prunicola CBS 121167]